jgi:AcrR family transcriptional regulator
MGASRTARERARAELAREIRDEARRQLAVVGADRLSLRSVARNLGMVSSALYRYFPSKDDLLTALIIDAYNALGDAVESAAVGASPRARWLSACAGARDWALAHPYEYALIYGSPVPGYKAPRDTVPAATRIPILLVRIVLDAEVPAAEDELTAGLAAQVEQVAELIAPGLPATVGTRIIVAWTQLFGMISFELFGQLVGSVDPSDEFFSYACDRMADFIGFP